MTSELKVFDIVSSHRVGISRLRLAALLAMTAVFGLIAAYNYLAAAFFVLFFCLVSVIYFWPIVGVYLIVLGAFFLNVGFSYNDPARIVNEFIPIDAVPILLTAGVFTFKRIMNSLDRNQDIVISGPKKIKMENLFLAMILVFIIMSLSWTIDFTHGVFMIFLLSLCFWIYKALPRIISTEKQIRNALWLILATSPALVTLLLLSRYYYDFRYKVDLFHNCSFIVLLHAIVASNGKIRMGGFAPVNIAANILGIILFVIIYLAFRSGWIMRFFLACYSLVILYCMFKTGSKAGLVTFMIGCMALLVMIPEFRKRLLRFTYVGIMVMGMLFVVAGKALLKRVELIVSGKVSDDRLRWWAKGFRHLYDSYFVGMGAGGFPKIIDPVPAAHSFYFSILFDYGLIGLFLFSVFLVGIFLKIRSSSSAISGDMKIAFYCLTGEMVALSIHAAVDADYIYVPFWLILGLMLAMSAVAEHEPSGGVLS